MTATQLREALFGKDYATPTDGEYCDHVPERAIWNGPRLCRCGRCVIHVSEMTACNTSVEFIEMVRRKMFEVGVAMDSEGEVFGAAVVASHEMGKFRKREFFETFMDVLKRANLDPRWRITTLEREYNSTAVFRLEGPQGIKSEKAITAERFSYDSNRLLAELVAWVLDIVPHAKSTDDVKPQALEPLDALPPGITRRIELE